MKRTTTTKLLLITLFIICGMRGMAQVEKGRWSVGYSAGATTATENGVMTFDYRYSLTDAIRLAPSLSHLLYKKEGYRGWLVETNMHYVLTKNKVFAFYPLAGISYSYWDYYVKATKSYKKGHSYVAPTIGVGAEIYVIEELVVGLDCKYNIPRKHDQLYISFRIAYTFAH